MTSLIISAMCSLLPCHIGVDRSIEASMAIPMSGGQNSRTIIVDNDNSSADNVFG